ncbi:MAG: large subunit ribosomal protein [Thermotogaceae bacterium]|jgi:large subunit ribosomal protein L29|nr:large subunit ribosomal protein [Thermotogaceae bacterium]MDN5337404.1 large subunit ribosomal protein [Thermotogaceae bacterium]
MKASELRGLSDQELLEKLEDAKRQLMNLRFQLAIGQLDNNSKIMETKRDIARIKTILRERELGIRR